jgi:hypothetical protein
MKRKETTNMFAEWFSIDPPYKDFNSYKEGRYVNGAISPFTAGELAKAAFNNGYEEYGWDIVSRFIKLVERDNNIFFLYYPDSRPQPEGGPSCWGAAAFISAVDEGLAGIKNTGVNYDKIEFSPKFPVTHYTELRYITGYELSHTLVDVRYILKEYGMRYDIISPAKKMSVRILLPKNKKASALLINGVETDFDIYTIGESEYVSFSVAECQENMSFEILFD